MAHDVIMPQMGESIAEGTITTWLKSVGEHVERDEPLFEISTDKVDAEIPAPESGVLLEIRAQAGETVSINTVVAVIGAAGEEVGASSAPADGPTQAEKPSEPAPAPSAPLASGVDSAEERRRTKSSPVVRKIAAEHGIDISTLTGSGMGGRVTKKDIVGFIDQGAAPAAASVQSAAAPALGMPGEIPAASQRTVQPEASYSPTTSKCQGRA